MIRLFALMLILSNTCLAFEELIEHYSPVIYQDIGKTPRYDFITSIDYDGDFISDNNWENADKAALEASIYYSVIESESHYFLTYAVFHPRDYSSFCLPKICHENDLEGIKLTILKDGSKFGRLRIVETIAHYWINVYADRNTVKSSKFEIKGDIFFEGSHPVIFIEKHGHGIYGMNEDRLGKCGNCLVYRFTGEPGQEPSWPYERQAAYDLRTMYDNIWQLNMEEDHAFANFFSYDNVFSGRTAIIPGSLRGNNWAKNSANLPWSWSYPNDKNLAKGDWFLDPAKCLAVNFHVPEQVARNYNLNSFLESI